jgi:Methyltransferase domain
MTTTRTVRVFNVTYSALGLALGAANAVRHRVEGYRTPRPFDESNIAAAVEYAQVVVDRIEGLGEIEWVGRRVLEIGPGSDLATGAVMMHRGAAAYHAIDAFDNRGDVHPRLWQHLGEQLGAPVDKTKLQFTLATFPSLPELDGEFDLIVSNATLEHIPDISELFEVLTRFARPGCTMVHHIDAQTHMRWIRDRDPLNILRYPDAIYDRLLSFPGSPNRLRADDYREAATEAGWVSPHIIPGRRADPNYIRQVQPHLAKQFRAREDIGLLNFTLLTSLAPR